VPGTVTTGELEEEVKPPGPVQLYETPGVVDEPVNVTLVVVQVNKPTTLTDTVGTVTSCDTTTVWEAVHPVAGLVTVTV
jgi:hypothetical protein